MNPSQTLYIITTDSPDPDGSKPDSAKPDSPPHPTGGRNSAYTGPTFAAPQPITPQPAPPEPITVGTKTLKRVPVDAQLLKAQMSGLIATLESLFEEAETKQGMQLSEVELSVEINGSGEISLLGTGAKLENTGGITMTFKRKSP